MDLLLCQPDDRKGCSACCGLFNFRDISRKHLHSFLQEGQKRQSNVSEDFEILLSSTNQVRDITSHICPYQGFIAPGKPGCLLHPRVLGVEKRGLSLFGARICDGFLCPAHQLLSHHEKCILINSVDDWYTYTLAIIDTESFRWMITILMGMTRVDLLDSPHSQRQSIQKALQVALLRHGEYLTRSEIPLFQYSSSEYNLHKKGVSLREENHREEERSIIQLIRGFFVP